MDPKEVKKVHDIYPDSDETVDSVMEEDVPRRQSINGTINHARPRPIRVPRPTSQSYTTFKSKQQTALRIGIRQSFDQEISKSTGVEHFKITDDGLTLHPHSQSKLSQQELIDLQKATHFDKKELQQWYKGMRSFQHHQHHVS